MQNTTAIEVTNLSFSYGENIVLENVNFTIKQGEFVGIIGSNGTGKSTLLKLLLGLLEPVRGKISFVEHKSKIGYVEQNAACKSNFPATAEEIVLSGLWSKIGFMRFPKKEHRDMVQNALKIVDMQDYSKRMIEKLSGGQQQRIMIARVLVNSPRVLILDEPTNGIDLKSSEALYELLIHLNKKHGLTIILVSHDIKKVSKITERLLCIEENSITEITTTEGKMQ